MQKWLLCFFNIQFKSLHIIQFIYFLISVDNVLILLINSQLYTCSVLNPMNCAILPLFFHMWCIQNLNRTKGITEFSIHTILTTVNSKSIILLLIHFCIYCLLKHFWYFTDMQLLNCWVLCFLQCSHCVAFFLNIHFSTL